MLLLRRLAMRAAVARPALPLQLRATRTASARLARAGASRSAGSGGPRSRDGGASGGGGPSNGAGGGPKQAKRRRASREQEEGHLEWSSSASASMGGDEERDTGGSPAMSDAMFQSLLNNAEAINKMRSAVLGQMAAAHAGGAGESSAPAPTRRDANGGADGGNRGRALDSDDYGDFSSDLDDDVSSADRAARAAAARLDVESIEYIQHHLPRERRGGRDGGRGGDAGGGRGAGDRRNGRDAPAGAGRGAGRSGGAGGGGRGSAGRLQPTVGGRVGALRGGTAIGRAVEARGGGAAVAVLREGKTRLFEAGSPMVYGGAIDRILGQPPPQPTDPIVVCTPDMVPIGWGVYNPASMFRVRLMQSEVECLQDDSCVMDMEALVDLRIRQAADLRAALGLLPADPAARAVAAAAGPPAPTHSAAAPAAGAGAARRGTTVFRLVNSEGDGLSGVVADQLGGVVVVQSCAAWSERYKPAVIAAIQRHSGCSRVVWRQAVSILREEGVEVEEPPPPPAQLQQQLQRRQRLAAAARAASEDTSEGEGGPDGSRAVSSGDEIVGEDEVAEVASGGEGADPVDAAAEGAVPVLEDGVVFLAAPEKGQKTGFYADQRDNRRFIASISAGRAVLDLCCYSGGFALTAAAAGAASAIGVDSSGPAVALAAANARANGLEGRVEFFKDDVSAFMRAAVERGDAWDVVVLDPPKLAPNRASLRPASNKYRKLNALALALVKPGGVLMTCSCSGAMTQSGGLPAIVEEAAREAERQVTLLRKSGAAPDHPLNPAYPEGQYLTALAYRVL